MNASSPLLLRPAARPLHHHPSSRSRSCWAPPATKQLINTTEFLVTEALEGFVRSHQHLQRLDGFPGIKVVFDKDHDKSKVAVISGGGSGHEPAHAGYVGRGMLSAAVCGEVFASPSAEAVLAAIRTVTGPAGCLLVIKNYTGDRLHFGLAAEQAKAEGLHVEMVVVGEDVAIEKPGLAGRRGLAGTVLVHKVAGALAAGGSRLEDVVSAASKVAAAQGTLGVALRVCTLPGKEPSDRLGPEEIEIGLGIHGEPGAAKVPSMPADQLVQEMIQRIAGSPHFGGLSQGERLVLLVNNLGATMPLEMNVVVRAALACLSEEYGATVDRVYSGPLMTSLDMAGVSLTLLKLQQAGGPELLELLDLAVGAPGWSQAPAALNTAADTPAPVPTGPPGSEAHIVGQRPSELTPQGLLLEKIIAAAATAIVEAAEQLDMLDAKVGDGDCGSTLAQGARTILADMKTKYNLNKPELAALALSASVDSIGGTSGGMYGVFFAAAARTLKVMGPDYTPAVWGLAFQAGVQAVQKYGGASLGSRTMLDALFPAAEACLQAAQQGESPEVAAARAAEAAAAAAEDTRSMTATVGRSSYVPAAVVSEVPDPGAVAVAIWIRAVAQALAAP